MTHEINLKFPIYYSTHYKSLFQKTTKAADASPGDTLILKTVENMTTLDHLMIKFPFTPSGYTYKYPLAGFTESMKT